MMAESCMYVNQNDKISSLQYTGQTHVTVSGIAIMYVTSSAITFNFHIFNVIASHE